MVQGEISPGSEITAITHFGAPVPVAGAPAYRAGSKRLAQGVQCGPDVGIRPEECTAPVRLGTSSNRLKSKPIRSVRGTDPTPFGLGHSVFPMPGTVLKSSSREI